MSPDAIAVRETTAMPNAMRIGLNMDAQSQYDSRAYLILLGPDGRMQWRSEAPFTEPSYARLKEQIEKLLLPRQ